MKRKLAILITAFLALVLSGCYGNRFTDEEKVELEHKGELLLEEVMPEDYKIKSVEAYIDSQPGGGPHYLTYFIEGEYEDADGKTYGYLFNTEDGSLYSSKYYDEAKEITEDYFLEEFGIDEDVVTKNSMNYYLRLDNECEERAHSVIKVCYLPIEVTDAYSYVHDKDRDEIIDIGGNLDVADETDLSYITLDMFETFEDSGFFISYTYISELNQDAVRTNNQKESSYHYTRTNWTNYGDFLVRYTEYACFEDENGIEEVNYEFGTDYKIKSSGNKYIITVCEGPDKHPLEPKLEIFAESDSKIFQNNYIDSDKKTIEWYELDNGLARLKRSFYSGEETIKPIDK